MVNLVCTLQLSKTNGEGLTLTIFNKDDEITQTVRMDGTTLTLTVAKGDDLKSTFTQTADTIAIKCKTFTLDADETITCTSKKASTYKSDDTLTLESTKEMTLTGKDKLAITSAKDMSLGSKAKLDLESTSDLSLTSQANVSATATASVELKGTAAVKVEAPTIGIKADGKLDVESDGIATLKGSITNVRGSLVNLG